MLADITDSHPAALRVRCDVIVEALTPISTTSTNTPSTSTFPNTNNDKATTTSNSNNNNGNNKPMMSEAASFALSHVSELLWNTGTRQKRSPVEWSADVRALFQGFDAGNTGIIYIHDI